MSHLKSPPDMSMTFKILITTFLLLHCFTTHCFSSDDFDMDELFSNDNFIVESDELEEESVTYESKEGSIDFSGSLYIKARYTTKRDDYTLKTIFVDYVNQIDPEDLKPFQPAIDKVKDTYHIGEDDWFTSTMTANLLFDIRLVENARGFINLDAIYYPYGYSDYHIATSDNPGIEGENQSFNIEEEKDTDYVLKEIFLDANIDKKVFFRAGKQVLQWGRGYFFNPTDLINVEKKRFLDMDANRAGTYGLKAHIPFGVKYNIYGFLDMGDEESTDGFAYAGKFEFLLDKSELSLSAWNKKGLDPVFGFDFSTRLGKVDIIGELSLTSKETIYRANDDLTLTATEDTWVPRCSLGLMKSFDFNEVNDRITVVSEIYYNHAGYSENIFDDPAKVVTLFANDMYSMYNHSVYYAIVFAEYKKFFISDLTLNVSGLGNFTDKSVIAMTQLKYRPISDFTLECSLSSTIGDGHSEYTFTGDDTSIEVMAKLYF